METVVFALMMLVCFNFMLKQTYRKLRSIWIISVVCALFVGLMWPYAIEQSKTQIADWLANPTLMLDTSVVLTLEVVIQISFCMLSAHIQSAGPIRKRTLWMYCALRWFPGILIFPVLFSALVAMIFTFPGVSFSLIAWLMAAAVFVLIPAGTYLLRWLLPEKDERLELLFLANVLIAVLGIIATVNGRTAVNGISGVDWMALLGLVFIISVGAAAGLALHFVRMNMRKNRIN